MQMEPLIQKLKSKFMMEMECKKEIIWEMKIWEINSKLKIVKDPENDFMYL